MKLPIRHEYFEQIKRGEKAVEYRDAHITFVDEETSETLRKNILEVGIMDRNSLPDNLDKSLFEDKKIVWFKI